ncbi:MAG: DNA-processing protein DprA [bacterium]
MKEGTIQTVKLGMPGYPNLLSQISDPPKVLYFRGDLKLADQPSLGIVGKRKYSAYGRQICEQITSSLARQGLVIVSGLALGIDSFAHQSALNNQGKTIAILGSGVDKYTIYPASNRLLAEQIIQQGGLVMSEYAPGTMPTAYSFPMRNRIIAGLSLGTLVVEAAIKSGALITSSCALDYNREVFAIPHPINSITGEGANNLLKQGAHLVTCAQDIIQVLKLEYLKNPNENRKPNINNELENKIWLELSQKPMHIDNIIKQTKLDSSTVSGTLMLMEIKKLVKNLGGMMYIKN